MHVEGGSFVGGGRVAGRGETIELIDPATGEVCAVYADAGAEVVGLAAERAAAGAVAWRALTAAERGRRLWALGESVRAAVEDLARIEAVNVGKPLADARAEALKVAEMFAYYAGWCDKITGAVLPVPTSHHVHTAKVPFGVVACILPWNAPLFTAGWNAAPALAAGNAVMLKPSELTPSSALALARLALEAGLPEGVLQVVNGLGATTGAALIRHEVVRKVTFVGSRVTGRRIAALAAEAPKPCVLELGGKSANIVFADADLEKAVGGAAAAIFSGAGQSCVAGSRLLVERSVHDEVVERLAALAQTIRVGAPLAEGTQVGPIQNARQFEQVRAMVGAAGAAGCGFAAGGTALEGAGFFFAPTVVTGAANDMAIAQEEVFGPVVAVIPFASEAEALTIANATAFGLAGAVWTQDPGRALRVVRALEAGTLWVNSYKAISVMAPFGGFKASGYGRSSGAEGLEEYVQTKSVWIETAAAPAFSFGYG
ncbi:MAG: aldehyde dehydrogenase family protein [Geminicoccaceae bacterium]|nr:MAG: aldehyde dehydrogenase family protein [Geminicoccaceae bacterium]